MMDDVVAADLTLWKVCHIESLTNHCSLGNILTGRCQPGNCQWSGSNCEKKLEGAGHKDLLSMKGTLVDYVEAMREKQATFLETYLEGSC